MIVLVVKVTRHLVVEDSFMVVLDHTITFRRVCGRQSYSSTECHMVRAKSITFSCVYVKMCRSQWPHGLRRRSAAAVLLRSWVRIPPGAWMFVCCECCVLSGRGLCDELITRPEESYRMRCVVVCDLETSRMRRPWTAFGRSATKKKNYNIMGPLSHMRSVVDRNVVLRRIPAGDLSFKQTHINTSFARRT